MKVCDRLFPLFVLLLTTLACVACAGQRSALPAGFHHEYTDLLAVCPPEQRQTSEPAMIHECTVRPNRPFTELIVSYNADVPMGSGLAVEVRAPLENGSMSSWRRLADWGDLPAKAVGSVPDPAVRVAIDELFTSHPAAHAEVRVIASGEPARVHIHRLDIVTTAVDEEAVLDPAPGRRVEWPVPFIPNLTEDPEFAPRLCSPTSLNMLINHRRPGVRHGDVVEAIYDAEHDLFGVWPRAIQTAWVHGVPGRLARFEDWGQVRDHLERVGPMTVSITAGPGEVRNMPYDPGGGHLIVLIGLTEQGDAVVLDPALSTDAEARLIYHAEDLTNVWLRRKRGTAYVLFPPARPIW